MGLLSPQWFTDSPWALTMVIIVYLWKNIGYVALIYLAGLQAVPQELDAAALDGAGSGRFVGVLPLLSPTTFFLCHDPAQLAAVLRHHPDHDPARGTTTLIYEVYQEAFGARPRGLLGGHGPLPHPAGDHRGPAAVRGTEGALLVSVISPRAEKARPRRSSRPVRHRPGDPRIPRRTPAALPRNLVQTLPAATCR